MDWNEFFFSDVGKKIKSIIRGIFYTEVILILIAGAILELKAFVNLLSGEAEFFLVMLAIPVGTLVIIGALWLSTLLTYGFGEIVDTATVNRKEQLTPVPKKTVPVEKPIQPEKKQTNVIQPGDPIPKGSKWCPVCNTIYGPDAEYCEKDGRYLVKY